MSNDKLKQEQILSYLSKDMMEKILHQKYPIIHEISTDPFTKDALNIVHHIHEYCWGREEQQRVKKIMDDVNDGKRSVPKDRYEEMQ
jgi:hypothetical protein